MITLAAFAAYFAWANMFAGGRVGWKQVGKQHGGPLPGRGIYYSGALAMIGLGVEYGAVGILIGFSFLVWRLPGWYGAIDAGLDAGTRLRDFLVMFARGFVCFPVFAWEAYAHHTTLPLALLFATSALIACAYDIAHRQFNRANWLAEFWTGILWGAAFYQLLGEHQ